MRKIAVVVGVVLVLGVLGLVVKLAVFDRFRPEITYAGMSRAVDSKTQAPTDETSTFDIKKDNVYCCIHFANIVSGTSVISVTWYAANRVVNESRWDANEDGAGWLSWGISPNSLDKGEYKAEIKLDGAVKKTLTFMVK